MLRRWLEEDGVSTSRFPGQAHQRGKKSKKSKKSGYRKPVDQILVKSYVGQRTRSVLLRRALHEIGVPERCVNCGTGPVWLDKPMALEVDHINGDWLDNRPENLRLLCPNCHAITATWCRGRRRAKPCTA